MAKKKAETVGADPAIGPGGAHPPVPPVPQPDDPFGLNNQPGAPKRMLDDGRLNPAWVRWAARMIAELTVAAALGLQDVPKGFNLAQAREIIVELAKLHKIDPKSLEDTRSEAQIFADAADVIAGAPDEACAQLDEFLEAAEEQMLRGAQIAREMVGDFGASSKHGTGHDAALAAAKKKWAERFSKIRLLKSWARDAAPRGKGINTSGTLAWKITHVLRYMVWVGRPGGERPCFIIAEHHVKMALSIYEAENKIAFDDKRCEWRPYHFEGVMLVVGPGHNKTTVMLHRGALRISQRPRLRVIMGHAQAEKATENLDYICNCFNPEESAGRRNLALFPGLKIERKNSKLMRLRLVERQNAPTITAAGIGAKINGRDADEIWFDDPCDQELSTQPTERDRIWDRMNGTWRLRKRDSQNRFEIITTTLWHHDDPNSRQLALIRNKTVKFRALVLPCGGPEQNFKPVYEECYPAASLRAVYAQMRNPRLYAAAFMCNPQPESLRKIKRLAYYDPTTDQHKRFVENAINHITLDPTAKKDEKCDKAAFLYGAFGDIVNENAAEFSYEKRFRVLDARQFHASQSEGVEEVIAYAESHSTHYIHLENRGGFDASREFFEKEGLDVICHDPGNRKKGLRLADVAAMLDDSLRDKGFPGAAVEFPGRTDDQGRVVADPESPLKWVEDQILDFGVAIEDHVVDALTQLLKFLGPELRVNVGTVTETIQRQRRESRDPRVARFVGRLMGRTGQTQSADIEDAKYLSENL